MREKFKATNGTKYDIDINEDGDHIRVYLDDKTVGRVVLEERLGDLGEPGSSGEHHHFHIIELSLEGCKGHGLGQRSLELHRAHFKLPLTAGFANRGEASDGSHLIGDGVGFIAANQMRFLDAAHQKGRELEPIGWLAGEFKTQN